MIRFLLTRHPRLVAFLNQARGESMVVSSARLLSAGCSLLVAVVSARVLGPAGRGEIVFVMTVTMLGSEFVSLGANVSGRIQILRRSGVQIEDYLGLVAVLVGVQAILMSLVLGLVGGLAIGLTPMGCGLGVLLGIAMFAAHMLVDAAFSLRRTLETGIRDLLIGAVPLLPVIVLASIGHLSVEGVLGLTAAGYLTGGGYLTFVVARRVHSIRFSSRNWATIIRNGVPVLGGTFGQTLAFRADRLAIGLLATSATLGVFSVSATAAELPRLLLLPVTQILANRVAEGRIPVSGIRRIVVRVWAGYGLILLLVALVGAPLVLTVVGDAFAEARDTIAVLAFSEALLGIYFLSVAVLTGLANFRSLPAPALAGALFILIGDLLVVASHSSLGAAWVRVVGFGVMAIVALLSARNKVRENA
ncbi:MAG TPA: hypothetical protein DGF10_00710 [Acidimicrobiaceae bacterium]|nr:hypothetical protein [Acidimicrobiaceae bacterium]